MSKKFQAPKTVIAIGASAGGLEPLETLLNELPSDLKDVTFIVAQQPGPNYKSISRELLSKRTSIEVVDAEDGLMVETNRIYVAPSNAHVAIENARFSFMEKPELHSKPSVSLLFKSIAQTYKHDAIGIVLSGTGNDGSLGVLELKKNNGISVTQDLDSCKYTGMPQEAIKTGLVNYILKPSDIGNYILEIINKEEIPTNKKAEDTTLNTLKEQSYAEIKKATSQIGEQKIELESSTNRLIALFNSTSQGHILLDISYTIVLFNQRAKEVHYNLYKEDLMEGKSYADLIPTSNFKKFQEKFQIALADKTSSDIEEYSGKKYFKYQYIPISAANHSESGQVLITFHDITAEKRSEKRLLDEIKGTELQKNIWVQLLNTAPTNIAIFNSKTFNYEYANPNYVNLSGVDNLVGKNISDVFSNKDVRKIRKLTKQIVESGKPYRGHERPVLYNNRINENPRYMDFTYSPISLDDGSHNIVVFATEVTQHVEAREEIKNTADNLAAIFESMPQKVFTSTPDGKNDFNNKQLIEFSGMSNQELIDEGWYRLLHPEDQEKTGNIWAKAVEENKPFKVKHRLKSEAGKYVWHLTRIVPIFSTANVITKWIGTSTDIDDQVKSEAKKDQFLNIASHELKTPLTSVIAYTELIKSLPGIAENEQAKLFIEKSLYNQYRLNDLISDLLDVTRIQNKKLRLNLEEVNYMHLIENAIDNVRHTQSTHKINLSGSTDKMINLDISRIEQVITNLLTNAIKYSQSSEFVDVRVEQKDGVIQTSVHDYGIGIPQNKISRIFTRFYRVSDSEDVASGLGIGLFIASELVKRHKGKIWLESKVNKGSTFYFSLPITQKV